MPYEAEGVWDWKKQEGYSGGPHPHPSFLETGHNSHKREMPALHPEDGSMFISEDKGRQEES